MHKSLAPWPVRGWATAAEATHGLLRTHLDLYGSRRSRFAVNAAALCRPRSRNLQEANGERCSARRGGTINNK